MIGINARVGQGWRMCWVVVVRRAICAVAQRCSVITGLEGHAVIAVVVTVRSGEAIGNDSRRGMCGEGGGEWREVIGLGRLSRLACLPECSPEPFTLAQLVFETGVILLEFAGFLAGLATGVLELEDNGLERGDWWGRVSGAPEREGEADLSLRGWRCNWRA